MRPLLITAGATHNPIDSMRSITAHASGQTGAWLAQELYSDFTVTFLGSRLAMANTKAPVLMDSYQSTRDLEQKMKDWVHSNPNGIVIHSAAVGDYEVKNAGTNHKIPSGQAEIHITLTPTPKILPQLISWSSALSIISFKAAPPETDTAALLEIARKQCVSTSSTLVFANVIGQTHRDVMLVAPATHQLFAARRSALEHLVQFIQTDLKSPQP